ncbi:alpha/beta hydrolase [Salibacterium qingdaonense]|uniref:Lysophospholipase, alpha-beta hydrolase superfamily n=1 Tax=Salibacterium qingdaonense TaxID=266892 RepID=A0A1I4NRN2_9BACI|nr:alpha/beta fold hydrolase [Salibacterium qingdaonense]SFM18055.1 Lysophospholipase, alpha-beta hydrolase superfamily [Salibacterium qingdaonense]
MKKVRRIAGITVASTVVIYLGLAHGLALFSETKAPAGEQTSLNMENIETEDDELPKLETYEARDGSTLSYRHYESDADQVLVLLHGSGYHSAYLQSLASHLAEAGTASVYTPDLRGHGPAPETRGDIDHISRLEKDVHDLIDVVRDRHPEASIVLGGHSSGGGTVIRTAGGDEAHPAVERYLLLAPYIHHTASTNQSEESGWANVNVPRMAGLSMLNTIGIGYLNGLDVISFNMPESVRDGTETLTYSYRLQKGMHPRDDYASDIAAMENVRVLAGSADESFHAGQYEKVFDTRRADVRLLDGLGHFGPVLSEKAHQEAAAWIEEES